MKREALTGLGGLLVIVSVFVAMVLAGCRRAPLPRPHTIHTDAAWCRQACRSIGMTVRQFDGQQPYSGDRNHHGCVCGEGCR